MQMTNDQSHASPGRLKFLKPGRNDPCWCGSGQKFKKCHLNRSTEARPDFFKATGKMSAAGRRGRCLHLGAGGGACSAKSIASHTVQRGGGLAAIAEAGHVLTTFVGFHDLARANGSPEPRKIGINDASTFPGFCNKHDTELFSPIEQSMLEIDPEKAFLFLYRAICLELVRKRHVVDGLPSMKKLDRGQSEDRQLAIQSYLAVYEAGLEIGLRELETQKAKLDAALQAQDWADLHYCQVEFDGLLPVTTACGYAPEFDWAGKRLQDLMNLSHPLETLSLVVTSYSGKTSVIFVWVGSASGIQRAFVESFLSIPDDEKASRLVAGCFEISENCQIRTSWWGSLDAPVRQRLSESIWNGTTRKPHDPKGLVASAPLDTRLPVKRVICSWRSRSSAVSTAPESLFPD